MAHTESYKNLIPEGSNPIYDTAAIQMHEMVRSVYLFLANFIAGIQVNFNKH